MNEPYRSFLLRLWLEPNEPPVWRAMLENPTTGERHGFTDLEAMFVFLRSETHVLSGQYPLPETNSDQKNNQRK